MNDYFLNEYEKDLKRQQLAMEVMSKVFLSTWGGSRESLRKEICCALAKSLLFCFVSGLSMYTMVWACKGEQGFTKEWACVECTSTPKVQLDMCRECGGEIQQLVGKWHFPFLGWNQFERKGSKDVNR